MVVSASFFCGARTRVDDLVAEERWNVVVTEHCSYYSKDDTAVGVSVESLGEYPDG